MTERTTFAVSTAGFWYSAAKRYQAEGKMQKALMAMENAFNHTENALFAERRNASLERNEQAAHITLSAQRP